MDERTREFELARHELTPHWTAERHTQLFAATVRRGRVAARRRTAGMATAVIAMAALLGVGLQRMREAPSPQPVAKLGTAAPAHSVRLTDGSRAELRGEHSELATVHDSPERVALKLVRGRAHFDVVPNPARSFVVEVPPYRVEVVGTVFDVDRSERGLLVAVTRGHVRVFGPTGTIELRAGQQQRFEPLAVPLTPSGSSIPAGSEGAVESPRPDLEAPPATSSGSPGRTRPSAVARIPGAESKGKKPSPNAGAASWRSLTRSGQYEAAFESLRRSHDVPEDAAALMDAADAARLSGHAQSAVQYLARVARGHRHSPVAPLAAFTLGRVQLEELGQPDLAAEAFELSRRLAPNGSMAQDALAREVEAHSKAGNADRAYDRAQEYVRRYPNGRRLRAVQLYGGLH